MVSLWVNNTAGLRCCNSSDSQVIRVQSWPSSSILKRENNVQFVQTRNKQTHSFLVLCRSSDQFNIQVIVLPYFPSVGLCCRERHVPARAAIMEELPLIKYYCVAMHCHGHSDVFYLMSSSQQSYK